MWFRQRNQEKQIHEENLEIPGLVWGNSTHKKKTNTELKPTNQKKKTKTTLSYLSSIEQPCIFSNITFYVLI